MFYQGDYLEDATVYIMFNTFTSDDPSASATITDFLNTDVHIHKDNGLTPRNNAAGITVSTNFDGITGSHMIVIDTSDDTVADFWVTGSDYFVRIEGTTIDGATINAVVGHFSIENRFKEVDVTKWLGTTVATPTTAGVPEVDLTYLMGTILAEGGAGRLAAAFNKLFDVATPLLVASEAMRGTDSAALASVLGALADAAADGDPTSADTVMQYVKQLINILVGTAGVVTFPAEQAPGNAISLAEVIRAIHADVTGLNGAAMRGTDGANTVEPDPAGTAATPAEVATALTDIHLDHLFAANYDPAIKPGVATALLNELVEDDGGVSRYTVNALENAPSGSGASAETIADAVWDEAQADHVGAGTFGIIASEVAAIPTTDPDPAGTAAGLHGTTDGLIGGLNNLSAADVTSAVPTVGQIQSGLATSVALASAQTDLDTLTGADGVTLATAQGLYPPAKAGDAMTLSAGAITAAVIATDAIDADSINADAVTKIQAGLSAANGLPVKNAAFSNVEFLMVDATDHITPETGLTVTGQRSLDGGAFAGVSGAIAEVANGIYQFDALAADTNGDVVTWRFSAAGAADTFITFKTTS